LAIHQGDSASLPQSEVSGLRQVSHSKKVVSDQTLFKREDGFFVGAILVNVVATEVVILLTYIASVVIIGAHYDEVLTTLFIIAVAFPIAFYHHSWSIWLSFDHYVEGLRRA
jgi:hypothetical protein